MKRGFTVRTIMLLAICTAIMACESGPTNSPTKVAHAYLSHLASENHTAAKKLLDDGSIQIYDALLEMDLLPKQSNIDQNQIKCETNGDLNVCSFCCDENNKENILHVVKNPKGKWSIKLNHIDEEQLNGQEEKLLQQQEDKLNKALEEMSGD